MLFDGLNLLHHSPSSPISMSHRGHDHFAPSGERESFHGAQLYELVDASRHHTIPSLSEDNTHRSTPPGLLANRRQSDLSTGRHAGSYPGSLRPGTPSSDQQRLRTSRSSSPNAALTRNNGSLSSSPTPSIITRTTSNGASPLGPAIPSNTPVGMSQMHPNAPTTGSSPRLHDASTADLHKPYSRNSKYSIIGKDNYLVPSSADPDTTFLLGSSLKQRPGPSSPTSPLQLPFPCSSPPEGVRLHRGGLFESPPYALLAIHSALCFVGWAAIFFLAPLLHASLFWTRAYVGALCSAFGIPIGCNLLVLVRRWSEAAAWATVIHRSQAEGGVSGGTTMERIAEMMDDSKSSWTGLRILWTRLSSRSLARRKRSSHDHKPWSLYVIFFLVAVLCESLLTFILGRIVEIDTVVEHQKTSYHERAVVGDLSPADVSGAQRVKFAFDEHVLTWTLGSFASTDAQASIVSFPWQNDEVYFAEATSAQLKPGGKGKGTFEQADTEAQNTRAEVGTASDGAPHVVPSGEVLRFPKWGIRIHCQNLPEPEKHLVPVADSGSTYVFLPHTLVASLFGSFNLSVPDNLTTNLNWTSVRADDVNDVLPDGLDASTIHTAEKFWNNGVAHSLKGITGDPAQSGAGRVQLETVLVRLNSTYAPNGTFPVKGPEVEFSSNVTWVGYDAAVCVELYESWIVDTANGTSFPSAFNLVGEGVTAANASAPYPVRTGHPAEDPDIQRNLSPANKEDAFLVAHFNGANKMLKDNGRDHDYVPSPTTVSFTDGEGPYGYTSLSPERFAAVRARSDAANALPYLVGRGPLLAYVFPDRTIANPRVNPAHLAAVFGVTLLLGLIAGCCVPTLPGGAPRRDTGMWGWITVLMADGLLEEARHRLAGGINGDMEVEEVQKALNGLRVSYKSL